MVPLGYDNGALANLTIKKLPDPLYRHLKEQARHQGRCLSAHVIHILQSDLNELARFERMRESNPELERLVASMSPMEDSTPLIREDRDRDN